MISNLKGRLRNTNLPKSYALLPLFEAVVNSIQSIDSRKKQENFTPYIHIKIKRSANPVLDFAEKERHIPEVTSFEIIDNGIGFTEENFKSFCTLDSEYKLAQGCRGVGRLLWLKAFDKVKVESYYVENEIHFKRQFDFSVENDVKQDLLDEAPTHDNKTCVSLSGFVEKYQSKAPKLTDTIARQLLTHCLWFFIREGGTPTITIYDEKTVICMDNIYDSYMLSKAKNDVVKIKNQSFDITHIKVQSAEKNGHSIFYCAADRVVKESPLDGKIPGLFGQLKDKEEYFTYLCFVSSKYLDEKVTQERVDFNIEEDTADYLDENELSFKEIQQVIFQNISDFLENYVAENKAVGREKLTSFIDKKAPRYRAILSHIPDNEQIVDPSISDKDLELKLHKHLVAVEAKVLSDGHELLSQNITDIEKYTEKLEQYLSGASDIKKSDLASYVSHRRVVLDLLSKALGLQKDDKYVKEEIIHKLIMPMQKESKEVFSDACNLWLIDERLAFHNYLASDKALQSMPITESTSTKEPDIVALNIYDNPILVNNTEKLPLASITVVELKRPMRNDMKNDNNPIQQTLNYLERIREGKVHTASGRIIPNTTNIPGYCYVIADLTATMVEQCKLVSLTESSDKMGYFGFNQNYNAYIEVISFDKLLNAATERNKAFFDKLGLPTV